MSDERNGNGSFYFLQQSCLPSFLTLLLQIETIFATKSIVIVGLHAIKTFCLRQSKAEKFLRELLMVTQSLQIVHDRRSLLQAVLEQDRSLRLTRQFLLPNLHRHKARFASIAIEVLRVRPPQLPISLSSMRDPHFPAFTKFTDRFRQAGVFH